MKMKGAIPMEYLVEVTTHIPQGTPDGGMDAVRAREVVRARELAAEGHVLRLWRAHRVPGQWRTLGLWSARDEARLKRGSK
jgi:muconolactone D-isomerase